MTVGLSTAVAGCTGDGDGDGSGDGGTPSATRGGTSTGASTDAGTTTDRSTTTQQTTTTERTTTTQSTTTAEPTTTTDGTGPAIPTYTFSEGESYTYETTFGDRQTEETWTVTEVDGDELAVRRETTLDGETQSQTITGTHGNIHARVTEAREVAFFGLVRTALVYGQRGELTAGNTFTVDTSDDENTDWDTETVAVAGETTVNGVTCVEFTVTPEDVDQETTTCLADDYPFAVALDLSQGGQTLIEMTLVESTRP